MKNLTAFSILLFSILFFFACPQNQNQQTNTELDDIVETPPEKKAEESDPVPSGKQTTTGTFSMMEIGDYFYIHIKDKNGKDASFMMLQAYRGSDQLNMDNWESMKGKRITVTWEATEEDIPESGGKMKVKKVLEVEVLE